MGIDHDLGFYVNHPTFLPTKAQLLGIAALLEDAKVVDYPERIKLEQEIDTKYPNDDDLITVFGYRRTKQCDLAG